MLVEFQAELDEYEYELILYPSTIILGYKKNNANCPDVSQFPKGMNLWKYIIDRTSTIFYILVGICPYCKYTFPKQDEKEIENWDKQFDINKKKK